MESQRNWVMFQGQRAGVLLICCTPELNGSKSWTLSHSFCRPGIWERLSWKGRAQRLWWGCCQNVCRGWGHLMALSRWEAPFQVTSLACGRSQLLATRCQLLATRAPLIGCSCVMMTGQPASPRASDLREAPCWKTQSLLWLSFGCFMPSLILW